MLQVERLTKSYGEKILCDDLSFIIGEKERIGLIGINGTGKSTFLKMIAQIDSADHGSFIHANDYTIEYLQQEPELDESLTVLEHVYYGHSEMMRTMRAYEESVLLYSEQPDRKEYEKQFIQLQQKMDELGAWEASTVAKTILTKLGIANFSQKVGELSGGQKKRVAIAKALIQPANLLLLDEPTNHLDNETIEWLEGYLSSYQGSIIIITHDRYFLNRVTNRIFELDRGQLHIYEGNYELFLEKKAERELLEASEEQKHRNLLRRELAWLKRGARARTTKQKARIQRVEQLQTKKYTNDEREFDFAIGSRRLGKQVIELQNVSKGYGERTLIKQLNDLIIPGERLGIVGPNGSGKTTLLQLLSAREQPDEGEVIFGETVHLGYYTQENKEIDGELRVIDYIKEVAEIVYTKDGDVITAEQMLERFLFPRSAQWTYIRKLSGGEKRRLYLLRVLMTEPNVLVLDEPTNDLDTQTLTVLEDYLDQFPGVVITVSHDRYFLDRVVNRLLVFEGDGLITRFQGHYTDLLQQKKLEVTTEKEAKSQDKQEKAPRKKLSYNDQRDWETIEDRIMEIEAKVEEVEMAISEAGSDYAAIEKYINEKEQLEEKLEQAMDRWTELSMLVEELSEK